MKAAFVDLDGTVCNSQKRFDKARENNGGRINWEVAFHPDLVALDELIPNTPQVLQQLEQQGWTILYLSSRPESLRQVTKNWLKKHKLLAGQHSERQLILKPVRQHFVSTPKWKAEVVCASGEKSDAVLVIDDELENLKAIKALWKTKGLDRAKLTCIRECVLPD